MALNPDSIAAGFGNMFNSGVMEAALRWLGYIVISVLILGGIALFYFYMQFKYKVSYPIMYYSKDKRSAIVLRWKKDRAMTTKKGGIKKQRLLFKWKEIEPFREEDIMPGNIINIAKINEDGTYVSFPRINFEKDFTEFDSLSQEDRAWGIQQLKENKSAFTSDDAQKRVLLMTIATVVLCLGMVALTVWLIMKEPGKVVASFDKWGTQFMDVAQKIGGAPK